MKKLSHKRVEELLNVLEEAKNTHFKDKHHSYPYTEWEHNRTKVNYSPFPDCVKSRFKIIQLSTK
jgi:hypothetical protein